MKPSRPLSVVDVVLLVMATTHAAAAPSVGKTKILLRKPLVGPGTFGEIPPATLGAMSFEAVENYDHAILGAVSTSALTSFETEAAARGLRFSVHDEFDKLFLAGITVDVRQPPPPPLLSFSATPTSWVIQFRGAPKPEWFAAIRNPSGLAGEILGFVESNGIVVKFPVAVDAMDVPSRVAAMVPEAQSVLPHYPGWRMRDATAPRAPGSLLEVLLVRGASLSSFASAASALDVALTGGVEIRGGHLAVRVALTTGAVAKLLASDLVLSATVPPVAEDSDERASSIVSGHLPSNQCLDYRSVLSAACGGCLDFGADGFDGYKLTGGKYPAAVLYDTVATQSYPSPIDGSLLGSGYVYSNYVDGMGNVTSGATEGGADCLGHGTMVGTAIAGHPGLTAACDHDLGIAPGAMIFAVKSHANCFNVGQFETFNDWAGATRAPKQATGSGVMTLSEKIGAFMEGFDSLPANLNAELRVVNNSWQEKEDSQGTYTASSREIDIRTRQSRDGCIDNTNCRDKEVLFVFAAGNASPGQAPFSDYCGTGEALDWDTLEDREVFSPGTARNALTVGGSGGLRQWADLPNGTASRYENDWTMNSNGLGNLPEMQAFGSAVDRVRHSGAGVANWPGRFKPDLMAPVQRFVSAKSQDDRFATAISGNDRNDYLDGSSFRTGGFDTATEHDVVGPDLDLVHTMASGTSFAAPQGTGAAILVTKFIDYRRFSASIDSIFPDASAPVARVWPSPDLVKATLIGHSRSMVGGRNPLFAPAGTPAPTMVPGLSSTPVSTLCGFANSNLSDTNIDIGLSIKSLEAESRLGQRPDRFQGWGLLNFAAVPSGTLQGSPSSGLTSPPATGAIFDEIPRLWANDILLKPPRSVIYRGTVVDSSRPVSVVVAWSDHPGAPGDFSGALVNDLDLRVQLTETSGGGGGGGGSTAQREGPEVNPDVSVTVTNYLGNCFASTGYSRSGCVVVDSQNNVESVFLPPGIPVGSVVEITIDAARVTKDCWRPNSFVETDPNARQDFGLYAYNLGSATRLPGEIVVTPQRCGIFSFRSTEPVQDSILWNFGDATTSTAATPDHFFSVPGTYDVTATINGSAVESATVEVLPPVAEAPPAIAVVPPAYASWTVSPPRVTLRTNAAGPKAFTVSTSVRVTASATLSPVAATGVTLDDPWTLSFTMPQATSIPGMDQTNGGPIDITLENLSSCGPVRIYRAFLRRPDVGPSAFAAALSRPFASSLGGETFEVHAECGFKAGSESVLIDGVALPASSIQHITSENPSKLVVTAPAKPAGVYPITVGGVIKSSTAGVCSQFNITPGPVTRSIEFVDFGYTVDPLDHRLRLFRSGAAPSTPCSPFDDTISAVDCREFPSLPVDEPGDINVAGLSGTLQPTLAFTERSRLVRVVDLSATTGPPSGGTNPGYNEFPLNQSWLPCPPGSTAWAPRSIVFDPYGKWLYAIHDQAGPGGPGACGGDGNVIPITILDRAAGSITEIATGFPELTGSIVNAGHPVDAVPHIVPLGASLPPSGTTYSVEGSSYLRRFLLVTQSGPALIPPIAGCPIPGLPNQKFTFPLLAVAYDLNTHVVVGGAGQTIPAAQRNFRLGYFWLDGVAGCSPPPYDFDQTEMGLDLATDGAFMYVVAPIASKVYKLRISDFLAGAGSLGGEEGECPAPMCEVAALPAGTVPTDAVVTRLNPDGPFSDYVITPGAGDDTIYRFDASAFSGTPASAPILSGSTSTLDLIPTAIASRKRAIVDSGTDFCFTANSAHGTVSKIAAATLATPLTIPIGSSVTRVAIQPLPSAAGFTERLELLIAGAPTTSFGAGNAGGTAPEQLREKVAGDLADLLEVVGEASSPLFVEIRADQLIEDAERFISEPSLQQRVILDAEAIKTFYQFEFEQQQ